MKKLLILFVILFLIVSCTPSTPVTTPTSISTPSPIATPTPKRFDVDVYVFHDLNGNGIHEENEPPVHNVWVEISGDSCLLNDLGHCSLGNVIEGPNIIFVNDPEEIYKYITPSFNEDIYVKNGLEVFIEKNTEITIPLVEGPYRSPFRDLETLYIKTWKDLDLQSCFANYVGDRECEYRLDWLGGQNTYDGHDGTDMGVGTDLPIYAMRSGKVITAKPIGEEGFSVLIQDNDPYKGEGRSYQSFVHLNTLEVSPGQEVDPETLIGFGGAATIGGTIHINQYIGVGSEHPANGDFRTNPYVPCPFNQRLWTSFNALAKVIVEIENLDGTSSGPQRQIYP